MQVIAVSNRKGGTGKTTVSVNLACQLAAQGQRVLLLDLDSQGHCGVGVGFKPVAGQPSVHHLFTDERLTLDEVLVATDIPGLWLAPANQLFDHGSGLTDERRLARVLKTPAVAARFDFVVVDTPPSLDALLLNALNAADWVLVPYVPHHLSYEGVRQLVRVLFRVMTGGNRGLKILGFLPTMSTEHVRQHRLINGEVSRQFGAARVLPGIRSDIRLAEAFAAGQPVGLYAPNSRGATDFHALALFVTDRVREDNAGMDSSDSGQE